MNLALLVVPCTMLSYPCLDHVQAQEPAEQDRVQTEDDIHWSWPDVTPKSPWEEGIPRPGQITR